MDLNTLSFVNTQLGFIGGQSGKLWKTSDGGNTWESIYFPSSQTINKILFVNKDTGYAGTENGIYKTVNSGGSWVNTSSGNKIKDISFPTKSTGYAAGHGNGNQAMVLKTTNSGQTWIDYSPVSLPPGLNAVCFLNKDTGFLSEMIRDFLKHMTVACHGHPHPCGEILISLQMIFFV